MSATVHAIVTWSVAFLVAIVILGTFYWIDASHFNWSSVWMTLLPFALLALGITTVRGSDAGTDSLGGIGNIMGIAACCAATAMLVLTYVHIPGIKEYQSFSHPLRKKFEKKPYVVPTDEPVITTPAADPADPDVKTPPKLQWFKIEVPDSKVTDEMKAFVQIETTVGDLKTGIPVLKKITAERGKIITWYENDKDVESRTADY